MLGGIALYHFAIQVMVYILLEIRGRSGSPRVPFSGSEEV